MSVRVPVRGPQGGVNIRRVRSLGHSAALNITECRHDSAMSKAGLAKELTRLGFELSSYVVGRIERGERRIDVDELGALAEALGVDISRLLEDNDGAR